MESDFWESRWREGRIGFHRSEPNPYLVRHALGMRGWPGRVFLPLAGKSLDVTWLADRGCEVVANEWVERAVRSFFDERGVQPERTTDGAFHRYTSSGITFYQGDFFELRPEQVRPVQWVFDRGSLIALPPDVRPRYVRHLIDLVGEEAEILLNVIEYDQTQMAGPPFSVPTPELQSLFEGWDLTLLEEQPSLDDNSRFRAAGLTWLTERVWRIRH
jgi:thiopurine S-methyltransferase